MKLSHVKDYKGKTCEVGFLSDMSGDEAEAMIGKTIASIDAQEHFVDITFTDGSSFTASGSRWDDCSMGAEYEPLCEALPST